MLKLSHPLLAPAVALVACFALPACQQQRLPSRAYFDEAETAYRAGNYDLAQQQYTYFLKQNPDPQLARLAERRILSISREIENVMGQNTGFRPKRVIGDAPSTQTPAQQPHIFQKNNSLPQAQTSDQQDQ